MAEESKNPISKIKEAEEIAKKTIKERQKQLEQALEGRILAWENKKQKFLNDLKKEEEVLTGALKNNLEQIEIEFTNKYEKELSLLEEKSKRNFNLLYEQLLKQIFENNHDSEN